MAKRKSGTYDRVPMKGKAKAKPRTKALKKKAFNKKLKNITKAYIAGAKRKSLENLYKIAKLTNNKNVKPILKKAIYQHMQRSRREFDCAVNAKECIYDLFADFSLINFMKKSWEFCPYYIKENDYAKLQTTSKFPVHMENYNYSEPIYKLANTINYQPKYKCFKPAKETLKNDIKFYISKEEDIIFSKIIRLKYKPSELSLNQKERKAREEKEYALYDNFLYNRSMSISMYVLLNGDPNKAMPFLRYDNDKLPHGNVYVGKDKRRKVFGDVALNPHFHFQNEEDSLCCLLKKEGRMKTGRCNAIDCAHLKRYLLQLDRLTQKEVEEQEEKNLSYNMPFLKYKLENKKIIVNADKLFKNFIKDKTEEEIELLKDLCLWLSVSKNNKNYNTGLCFDKLIRGIDFLNRIAMLMDCSLNLQQRKLYSQLEIVVADSVMNAICNNNSNYILKDYKPKYTIKTNLFKDENQPEK